MNLTLHTEKHLRTTGGQTRTGGQTGTAETYSFTGTNVFQVQGESWKKKDSPSESQANQQRNRHNTEIHPVTNLPVSLLH